MLTKKMPLKIDAAVKINDTNRRATGRRWRRSNLPVVQKADSGHTTGQKNLVEEYEREDVVHSRGCAKLEQKSPRKSFY